MVAVERGVERSGDRGYGHSLAGMPVEFPTRFGGREQLSPDEIEGAPLRSLPRPSRLAEPLDVKPAKAAKALTALGIETRGDLLEHLPFRLEDRREVRSVATLGAGEDATVVVEVRKIAARRAYRRRRLVIVEATVADESGPMKATFFNQPWLVDRYPPGTLLVLHGRYTGSNRFNVSEHEQAKGASADDLHSTGLVPVYPASEGIPAPRMRELVFEQRGLEREVVEPLPSRMRAREQLPDRAAALAAVHFPDAEEDQDGGRRRLAFDEFLALQLTLLGRREERRVAGAEALEGDRDLTARWLSEALPFELTGDQRAAMDALDEDLASAQPAQRLLMGEVGSGKAQPLDALVLTPTGFRRMGSLKPGDELVTPDGGTTVVTGVFPQGARDVWRVHFSDGSSAECDYDHLWQVQTSTARCRGETPKVMTLREIAADVLRPSGYPKWHLELPNAADFDGGGARPLDPYVLGLLLGDGALSVPGRVRFTTADPELLDAMKMGLPSGCVLRQESHRPYDWNIEGSPEHTGRVAVWSSACTDEDSMVAAYRAGASADTIAQVSPVSAGTVRRRLISAGVRLRPSNKPRSPLVEALDSLDLMGKTAHDKAIPTAYLNAPIKVRHAVLQGLMDTDGTVGATGLSVSFLSASQQLAEDVAWLVRSLGGRSRCRRRVKREGTYWYTGVALPPEYPPFRLGRKAGRVRAKKKYGNPAKAIVRVERSGRKQMQCISVAHPSQLYVTNDFTTTHNTVIALYAMLRAVEHGAQAALMAPTETLADQHFATLQELSGGELVPMALLTGSTPAARRNDIVAKLASGELPIVVGTHALVEDDVAFDRLAVTVVDEQHRFGVRQRVALDRKGPDGRAPHTLHLTATPIPRTLALTAYGDLDVTTLRELPAGRKPITTHLASTERERARAYERIREEVRGGRQAFVVCPLVEESEVLQAKAATEEFERLRTTEFTDLRVALLHGQLRPRAKQEAMAAFAAGEADVLVATSVIEVGIDVPNATVMLVEDAERYGISQLHQLRGRVGRGGHASVCLLFGSKDSPRLQALVEHDDGFDLAEIDLSLRGEGELLGTRQSGLAELRAARLPEDADVLARARAAADELLADDPALEAPQNALLRLDLERRFGERAHEPIPA